MKKLLLILLIFCGLLSYSQPRDTYTTTSGGSWVNVLNWDIGVPDNDQTNGSDDIIITHHITLTDDLTVKSGTNITITGCDTLHVTGNVAFNNGSAITVEPCAVLIIDGNLTNNNNSTDVQINGKIIIGGNYDGGTGSELTGTGEMEIDGTVTTDGGATVFGSETDCTVDCDNSNADPLGDDPLPVTLLWFNGAYEDDELIVRWATASEINNQYFIVERMGVNNEWFEVERVVGNGNTNKVMMYQITDYTADFGYNYYRLTQVDYDGNSEVFKIISILKPYDLQVKDLNVYPNPTTSSEDVSIELTGFRGEEILIVVMNTLQQIFFEKAVVVKDENIVIVMDSKLPAGTYLVIGSEKQELYRRKLIIK